jgi:cell division protein FtsW (lipid II flippase)
VRRKGIYNLLGGALLALFCIYWAGVTLFPHVHELNGVFIVHSHFSNAADDHTHSNEEHRFIAKLSAIVLLAVAVFVFVCRRVRKEVVLSVARNIILYSQEISAGNRLRGPPSPVF